MTRKLLIEGRNGRRSDRPARCTRRLCKSRPPRRRRTTGSRGAFDHEGAVRNARRRHGGRPLHPDELVGMTVKILTYGGIIQQVWVPDQRHHLANVTLGLRQAAWLGHGQLRRQRQQPVLRRADRPLRKPDRERSVHAQRDDLPPADQQPAELAARRHGRVRQARLDGDADPARDETASGSCCISTAPTATRAIPPTSPSTSPTRSRTTTRSRSTTARPTSRARSRRSST